MSDLPSGIDVLPLPARLQRWAWGSPARQRMATLSGSTALFCLGAGGAEVVLPLWLSRDLGWSAGQWASLRSVRFIGVLVGVVLLGAMTDRIGARRMSQVCVLGAAAALAVFASGKVAVFAFLMAVYGPLMSTLFVNVNALVQGVSDRRLGLANTLYRAVGSAVGIVAPPLATALVPVMGGYPPVILAGAAVLALTAVALQLHPEPTPLHPLRPLSQELAILWSGYRVAWRQRPLMRFLLMCVAYWLLNSAAGAFAPMWFVQKLGWSDAQYGLLCSLSAVVNLAAVLVAGVFLDRVSLKAMHLVLGTVACAGTVLMAFSQWPALSAAGLVLSGASVSVLVGGMSMWVTRTCGDATRTSAFAMQKLSGAFSVAAGTLLAGWGESLWGMKPVLLATGLAGLASTTLFLFLPEPPRFVSPDPT